MIPKEMRRAVLFLRHKKNFGTRRIARALEMSRTSVIGILSSQNPEVPPMQRSQTLTEHLELIRELHMSCEGNLSRVAEELSEKLGKPVPYSTVTRFCRKHKLGSPCHPSQPAGEYHTGLGVEMQHDTSPISMVVGGRRRLYQAASLKLGCSRMRYLRFYRRFTRFACKDFLTRGLEYFEGACERIVIDNTSVIVAHGSGKNAVMAPEMEAFEKRFGFKFLAHELGDANRKAKVERDFDFIQKNFPKGRRFTDDDDLNRQALLWCEKKNAKPLRKAGFVPCERFRVERAHLKRLPDYVPPVYQLHRRRVDASGFVSLDSNDYSAPNEVLGREITLRETMETVTLLDGPRELCVHPRLSDGARGRSRLPGHGRRVRPKAPGSRPQPEELWLASQPSPIPAYLEGSRSLGFRRFVYQVRLLYRLCHEYDPFELTCIVTRAMAYGLYDAARLERMLLEQLGARLFGPPQFPNPTGSTFVKARSAGDVTPQAKPQPREAEGAFESRPGTGEPNAPKEGEPRG